MPTSTKTKTVKPSTLTMEDVKDFIQSKVDMVGIDKLNIKVLWEKNPAARTLYFRLNFYQEIKDDSPFTNMEIVKSMFVRVDNSDGVLTFNDET